MPLPRHLSPTLQRALRAFPAVLVTGPRQSGKTTFLRDVLRDAAGYVTFDDPLERDFARNDPNGFLARFDDRPVILDEVQYVPEILPYLKIRIDREREVKGRWVLTGSQQFGLMAGVSETLAGRIALLELPPFSISELSEGVTRQSMDLEQVLWTGLYPEPALAPGKRDLWLSSYLHTYVERDVRQLQNIRDLRAFETFVALAAARHGQELKVARLAAEVGLSQPTAGAWLTALEAAYLVARVPPYFENLGKRLVRSPKLYFLDPGLVTYLTRQPSAAATVAGAMAGPLFEGLVISEVIKTQMSLGRRPEVFHWRSHDGLEVDLVLLVEGKLVPVEIKLTATPNLHHLEPLASFRSLAGQSRSAPGVIFCRVAERREMPGGVLAMPWNEVGEWVGEKLGETSLHPPA